MDVIFIKQTFQQNNYTNTSNRSFISIKLADIFLAHFIFLSQITFMILAFAFVFCICACEALGEAT